MDPAPGVWSDALEKIRVRQRGLPKEWSWQERKSLSAP
jgi:hypothetical protein